MKDPGPRALIPQALPHCPQVVTRVHTPESLPSYGSRSPGLAPPQPSPLLLTGSLKTSLLPLRLFRHSAASYPKCGPHLTSPLLETNPAASCLKDRIHIVSAPSESGPGVPVQPNLWPLPLLHYDLATWERRRLPASPEHCASGCLCSYSDLGLHAYFSFSAVLYLPDSGPCLNVTSSEKPS